MRAIKKAEKLFVLLEAAGIIFVLICRLFMSKLYTLCGGNLVGVMFGSVNKSIWENCKILLLPYLFWSLIELMSVSPHMRRFTSCKTISLYFLGLSYIGLSLIFSAENQSIFIAALCTALAFVLSFALYRSKFNVQTLFAPSVFLLFLFWAVYFSFTPFPPQNAVFLDSESGLYGIIPTHIDLGAAALDAMYYFS